MKTLFLIAALLISSGCLAQTVTYIKGNRQTTLDKDSALYVRTIIGPVPGSNLFLFSEALPTGELMRSGKTLRTDYIQPDVETTIFYPSGKQLMHTWYEHARPVTETTYYPGGGVYMVKEYTYATPDPAMPNRYNVDERITTCNDASGKGLVINGNGRFVTYLPDLGHTAKVYEDAAIYNTGSVYEEGNIKDGKKDGEWTGKAQTGKFAYTETYKDGKFIAGRSTDSEGNKHEYAVLEKMAEFNGGVQNFYAFLGSNIRYPASARINNVQGKVYSTFVVGKDGQLTDIKIMRGLTEDINAETLRVLELSPPWVPGMQRGIAVRQQYTVPVSYTLSERPVNMPTGH